MNKTLAQIAVQAYCDELSRGSDSMNVASDLEPYEVRCIEAAANAIIEECAKVVESFDHTKPGAFDPWTSEQAAAALRALKTQATGGET